VGRVIPYIIENKKCSKPPTSEDTSMKNTAPILEPLWDFGPPARGNLLSSSDEERYFTRKNVALLAIS